MKDIVLFVKRSVEGGNVQGQIIIDVINDIIDFSVVVNMYVCDFIGDIYFFCVKYDFVE